jgi:hypothetical protein
LNLTHCDGTTDAGQQKIREALPNAEILF